MSPVSYATCPLCEAVCGIAVEHDGKTLHGVRGDPDHPLSRGYICPKGAALPDLHADPDRVRHPLRRAGGSWTEISWDDALEDAAGRIHAVQKSHGPDAVAIHLGNPTIHSYSALLSVPLWRLWGTKNFYSSNSVDAHPRLLASYFLYGSPAILAVPDLDRTAHLVILGANPAVSNGSIMTAPGAGKRIAAIRARGGRVVVIDPRRTETAALADEHYFIRPGTDAVFLLAVLHTIFTEKLDRPGHLDGRLDGVDHLKDLCAAFPPERAAPVIGMSAGDIRAIVRGMCGAPRAVLYSRVGTSTHAFGTLSSILVDAVNIVTGNMDAEGGAMFAQAAVDLPGTARRAGLSGHYGRWRGRVSGRPEIEGELPGAFLAEEMETPGRGQVRALVTHGGNPVLSFPHGRRLENAIAGLEARVAVDIYRNETTAHADIVLPPSIGLERDHYSLVFHSLSVRNTASFSPAVISPPPGTRPDWQIVLGITARLLEMRGGMSSAAAAALRAAGHAVTPRDILALAIRFGPHGKGMNPLGKGLTLGALVNAVHGVDLGALRPRLLSLLGTRRITLAPDIVVREIQRLEQTLLALQPMSPGGDLLLIGRRSLRSNNSWMHNIPRLVSGHARCTLLIHPRDAGPRTLRTGDTAVLASRVGQITVPVEVSEEIMPGVVCLPHGWGHGRAGSVMRVAAAHRGASINDVTDDRLVDGPSGTAGFNGVPVRVTKHAE